MRALVIIVVAAALTTACAEKLPENRIRVSGHVEATEVHVSAEVGGRIVELKVDEGTRVRRSHRSHRDRTEERLRVVLEPACRIVGRLAPDSELESHL